MIELAIKKALEKLSDLNVYPLLLPDPYQEGITYMRVSDAEVGSGLVRSGLVSVRFQITTYLLNDYTRIVRLDNAVWNAWKGIVHGNIEGVPVQYVERGGIQQRTVTLPNNAVQYGLARDYILTIQE